MLKPDAKARIETQTFEPQEVNDGWFKTKTIPGYTNIVFCVGSKGIEHITEKYQQLLETMKNTPVQITSLPPPGPHWWWYREIFYKTSEILTADDVITLIAANTSKKDRRLAHAHAVVVASKTGKKENSAGIYSDRYITPEVKQAAWQRDEGRCVRCGSNENLEFDHIIPVSMGGSSTVRNIQLLCEACNRSKGGSIV